MHSFNKEPDQVSSVDEYYPFVKEQMTSSVQ